MLLIDIVCIREIYASDFRFFFVLFSMLSLIIASLCILFCFLRFVECKQTARHPYPEAETDNVKNQGVDRTGYKKKHKCHNQQRTAL
jgi:hypothetical protein